MKKASVRDLHLRPVAELRAISRKKKVKLPRMTELWAKLPQFSGDSTDIISEDRDRCL
jgi:hypothetical protein